MLSYKKINVFFLAFFFLLFLSSFYISVEWWYYCVLLGFRFILLLIGSFSIQWSVHIKTFCSNPEVKEKQIAITFDDGPSLITPQILALLRKYDAKATFFCIGKNIEKHPDILCQIDKQGHLIGNHSFSHSHFFDFFGKKKIIEELVDTDEIIKKYTGKQVRFFRPPYGVTNPAISKALRSTKHNVIGWNIRSLDGVLKNEEIIYKRIIKRVSPGGIILLHDTSLTTVRVLERLLLFLQNNNYKVVATTELLNLKAYEE